MTIETTATFQVADATKLPFADMQFDLVLGSPPYCDARTYGIGAQRDCAEWVDWMLTVTTEALRVSKGAVIWVAAGVTRDWTYWPACEGLMWEWWKRGGSMFRPVYWHRVGIPGSGGEQWFRADVEYCMAFKRAGKLPWADNTAFGHLPRWAPGGAMSHRLADGQRTNQWGKNLKANGDPTRWTERQADGELKQVERKPSHKVITNRKGVEDERVIAEYTEPYLANPGNFIHTNAGYGHLGDNLSHQNEAPFSEYLAEFFIRSLCPAGGTVLDPFSGSATTIASALKCGRSGVGTDIRQSQIDMGKKRIRNITKPFDWVA